MPTRYVCVIIWRRNPEEGHIEFLVLDSRSTDPNTGLKTLSQVKFPGGMNRVPGEPLEVTMQREVLEETHLAFLPASARQIWEKSVNAEHVKYGVLVSFEDCRGEIRKEILIDNGDEMSPPYWAKAETLGRELYRTHQMPYLHACKELGVFM